MSIGSNIKRLRREKDITQEQLAEYLGITSRAISQWECDRTAPDISQLPALCHIFDVSSDVLLGIDVEKNEERIKSYLEEAHKVDWEGNFEKEVELLREALGKFPRSYQIMQKLANALVNVYSRKGVNEYEEVFALCNRVLAECTDSQTRYEATQTLVYAYDYAGKKEEMLKVAEEMPKSMLSYENCMLWIWEGDADFAKKQDFIHYLIYQLVSAIGSASLHRHDDDTMIYVAEDRMRLHKLQVDLLELLFPDKDYQNVAQVGWMACLQMGRLFLQNNDLENAWKWLEKSADFAIHMDTYDFEGKHTSPVLRGYSDGGSIPEAEGNISQMTLNWLLEEEFDILRTDERYEMFVERVKKFAKKP